MNLRVMIDVLAFVQLERACQLRDVHNVRHVVVAEAQYGERPARGGVSATGERPDLNGDVAELSEFHEPLELGAQLRGRPQDAASLSRR
jgi:hypothetical protein